MDYGYYFLYLILRDVDIHRSNVILNLLFIYFIYYNHLLTIIFLTMQYTYIDNYFLLGIVITTYFSITIILYLPNIVVYTLHCIFHLYFSNHIVQPLCKVVYYYHRLSAIYNIDYTYTILYSMTYTEIGSKILTSPI